LYPWSGKIKIKFLKKNAKTLLTTQYNGRQSFGRFHIEKNKSTGVYTTNSFNTRLDAQKVMFLSVYTRFSKFLSAWVGINQGADFYKVEQQFV